MTRLTNHIIIDAPADKVWEVVGHHFDRIGEWASPVASSTGLDGTARGRVCHTGMRLVPRVSETIVAYDETARTLTYEVTEGMPPSVALARNEWRVTEVDGDRARVSFQAHLEVRGLLGAIARQALLLQVGRAGGHLLDDLKHYVEHGTPSPRKARTAARRLRVALRANAAFSIICGAALLFGGRLVAEPWGLGPAALVSGVGAAVAVYGAALVWLSAQPVRLLRRFAWWAVAADLAWVSGSALLLLLRPMPAPGRLAVAEVAAAVLAFAVWQLAGLLRRDRPEIGARLNAGGRLVQDHPESAHG
jgi:hypothetical protein